MITLIHVMYCYGPLKLCCHIWSHWSQRLIQELGIQPGELPTTSALQKLVERHQVMPSHVVHMVPLAMWT